MSNYEAIRNMTPEQLEAFLDQVYLAGLNNGMYAARQKDDTILDDNPFNVRWLADPAEMATALGWDDEGDVYMLHALVESILRNAGIPLNQ